MFFLTIEANKKKNPRQCRKKTQREILIVRVEARHGGSWLFYGNNQEEKRISYFQTKGGLDIYEVGKRHLELAKEKAIQ